MYHKALRAKPVQHHTDFLGHFVVAIKLHFVCTVLSSQHLKDPSLKQASAGKALRCEQHLGQGSSNLKHCEIPETNAETGALQRQRTRTNTFVIRELLVFGRGGSLRLFHTAMEVGYPIIPRPGCSDSSDKISCCQTRLVFNMDRLEGAEVAKRNSRSSCWIAVHGNVYDVTGALQFVPFRAGR
jgi:cytochrome b involved in lipid metabolism